jgi:hypothetical protein
MGEILVDQFSTHRLSLFGVEATPQITSRRDKFPAPGICLGNLLGTGLVLVKNNPLRPGIELGREVL